MQLEIKKKKKKSDKTFQTCRCVKSWDDATGPRANFDKDQFYIQAEEHSDGAAMKKKMM